MKRKFLILLLCITICISASVTALADAAVYGSDFTAAYSIKLNTAPGTSLDEAQAFLDELLAFDGTLPDAAVSAYFGFIARISDALWDDHYDDDAFAESLGVDSIISPRYGEGGIGYALNYGATRAALTGRLSDAFEDYLTIMAKYFVGYIVDDMALMLTWDELAQLLVELSVFRISYPRFDLIATVDSDIEFCVLLYAGCYNLDNTPVIYYDDTLNAEVKASYEKFLSDPASGDVLYYDDIALLYDIWKANDFKCNDAVRAAISALENKLDPMS